MKLVALLPIVVAGLSPCSGLGGPQPRGTLLELHSCELYAGGCVVSGEATQAGRYMLRVWDFNDGEVVGAGLAGLRVALLQTSPDNLAAVDSATGPGVVYLPKNATAEQRTALLRWVESAVACPAKADLETRVVPLELTKLADGYRFAAGDYVSVRTAPLTSCPTGACGEALWYTPRTQATTFTVVVNRSSQVAEPLLKLKWEDRGKKSVFLAQFGEGTRAENLSLSSHDLCSPGRDVF